NELPPEHLNLSTSLFHLGQLKHVLSDLEESALLLRKALAIREKRLGRDDLLIADVQFELAWVLHDMRSDEQAETLIREVMKVRKQRLGAKPPQVAASNALLALVLVHLKRYDDAVKLSLANLDTSDMVQFTLAYQRAAGSRKQKKFGESEKAFHELLAII